MSTSLLKQLYVGRHLRTLDHALATSLLRLRDDTPDAVAVAAALASLAVSQGHAGFDPAQPGRLIEGVTAWPPPPQWLAQLRASPWVAQPDDPDAAADEAPLVLENGLLYLRRYREYERQLAAGLQRIGRHPLPAPDMAALAPLFARLFPAAATQEDHQARAAGVTLRHPLALVTGGPGTGKTTTIARLLLLLAAQALQAGQPAPQVALAAPTGRAAERMAESLRLAVQRLQEAGLDPALCAALPSTGTTLHRLLGVIPDSPRFRHHADNPLPVDVVVVDEASMIDLPLMAKLVDAIASGTRLILLGDPDQLPSVEAGDVLSAILRASGDGTGTRVDDAQALHGLLAAPTLQPQASPSAFAGRRVQLQRGYRQSDALQLAPLAQAVREGDARTALSLLRDGSLSGVSFHEHDADPLRGQREHLLSHWRALADAADPGRALQQAGRLRVLTALREGPQGARGLNSRIEQLLAGNTPGYFQGRLLLITENSYRHRLFNGDIGICLRDPQGAMAAWFPGDTLDQPRAFHPAALPAHESAFAMTVHKAQGSEFDEVWLQLPRQDSRVLSRELVYTGLTRARQRLHLAGSEDVLVAALKRHASRLGGLAWRLGA
ncbi:exodeoxyribonuclease V subunit alpha [Stenotrophomonas sp. ZAC14D2_NAIMI4_6]|uniref:exodeoxyribonuclease V subunit alpha n=1 Tax=Stenotrophomonas sp. ZAC14D2_NAIMI4_6 TaxID=2072406 RepID=UPI000D541A81|nr:exodeoxyribonuclease V subunit alpha [Stenotrophomonas sp. ZAC14D2_NAIMI4_6]AWH23325.1 exodeoxyribonuclease V subunit alpha [Stenotrophomonas sp. ZAC14D2_NAIMI4_6]